MTPSGWFDTGDLGYFDSVGQLWLCGRSKDMIKSGGENVHAADVERALRQVPSVHAAAVVGLPDTRLGESVCALLHVSCFTAFQECVVQWATARGGGPYRLPVDSASADAWSGVRRLASAVEVAYIRHVCSSAGLAGYKQPRLVALQSMPVPTNSTGKMLKPQAQRLLQAVVDRTRSKL